MIDPQLTLDAEVDAFRANPPPRPPLTTRITCRVCDQTEEVPILSNGLLCGRCRADLDATERHIRDTLAAAEGQFQGAIDAWDAAYAQADPRDQERYHAVCEARAAGVAGFREKYARALARGDGLSVLLRQSEAVEALVKATERTRGWAERALEEVEAVR